LPKLLPREIMWATSPELGREGCRLYHGGSPPECL